MIVSIDIETTGLDHSYCQILEFGAVIDDLQNPKPLEELPKFHCYVDHPVITGEPYGLAMNAKIIERIAKKTPPYTYLKQEEIHAQFHAFLVKYGCQNGNKWAIKVNVAGKNFACFDKRFIEKIWPKNPTVVFNHRIVDPAMLYFNPTTDEAPPSLSVCLERAGINKTVAHTAVEDALDVLVLIRKHYGIGV
jgi:oligoribonuclease (3'-5' exoribonuclease)